MKSNNTISAIFAMLIAGVFTIAIFTENEGNKKFNGKSSISDMHSFYNHQYLYIQALRQPSWKIP